MCRAYRYGKGGGVRRYPGTGDTALAEGSSVDMPRTDHLLLVGKVLRLMWSSRYFYIRALVTEVATVKA